MALSFEGTTRINAASETEADIYYIRHWNTKASLTTSAVITIACSTSCCLIIMFSCMFCTDVERASAPCLYRYLRWSIYWYCGCGQSLSVTPGHVSLWCATCFESVWVCSCVCVWLDLYAFVYIVMLLCKISVNTFCLIPDRWLSCYNQPRDCIAQTRYGLCNVVKINLKRN